ncbi:MAG: DoxX family protein [Rickettsiales bacterium]|jgi:putative oxidoreductase|nr:DoxX family protein [Rickettsiales bacterium]
MLKSALTKLCSLDKKIVTNLDKLQFSITVICRVWLAKIFFFSGLTKLSNWDQTLILFEYEYAVPLLPVNIAAALATTAEITLPIFLILGLLTRYCAFALLIMISVIQFAVIPHDQHLYWMLMSSFLIFFGPGKLSLDHLINIKYRH